MRLDQTPAKALLKLRDPALQRFGAACMLPARAKARN